MLDEIDIKILGVVQKNAGLPLSEISKKVGVSPTPCWNRIKKWKKYVLFLREQLFLIEKLLTYQ